ncbi:multidrug transporter [Pasteurellaceae bacterium 15-036681]|nr:multidrug transporter [Pasteurellaceae bacterium 15-036681]
MFNSPLITNLIYVFGVGINIVLLRYFSLHIHPANNNGVRFTIGGILLLLLVWWKYRHHLKTLAQTPKFQFYVSLLGIMMATNMFFYLKGVALTSAVTASIFGILAMPFAIIIAAIFFIDERNRIKNKAFWLGSGLAIVGSLCFVGYGKQLHLGDNFVVGGLFLFTSIVIQGTQSLIIKAITNKLNAFTISAFTSFIAGILSLTFSVQTGNIAELSQFSSLFIISLIFVGIFAITTGMVLGFHVVQTQGITTYQILQLLLPISTAIISYFALDEQLSFVQFIAGIVVILGAAIALRLFK